MEDLQLLVDRLAHELRRGVVIEDHHFRLVAHSAHQGGVDSLRSEAILNRETPREVREWFRTFGIEQAKDWLRTPANPSMGIEPRVCVPIRFADRLLGHMWIIERDTLPDTTLVTVRRAADTIGVILYRRQTTQQIEQGLERESIRDLLDDSATIRQQAATHLVESDLFRSDAGVCVVVCTNPGHDIFDEASKACVDRAVYRVRTSVERRDMLHLIRPNHAVVLLTVRNRPCDADPLEIATHLRTRLDAAEATADMVISVGSAKPTLEQARESYDEALRAARIAHAFPSLGRFVSWTSPGVYRLLSQFITAELDKSIFPDGILALLEDRHSEQRLQLLEVYLDSGCNAVTTASQLGIHRASVYYRISRIEQIIGASLSNGLDRLAVHLSVKLIRLGRQPLR